MVAFALPRARLFLLRALPRVCRAPDDGVACGLMFRGASWNGQADGNGLRRLLKDPAE